MKKAFTAIALALVAALTLAGCGNDNNSSSSETSGGDFNDADVTFAQSMIPHHQQAVQMAQLAQTHASSTDVKELADKIEAAQGPEIETMTGWLEAWGEDVPSGSAMGGGMGHDMGDGEMAGMMTGQDMKELDGATGKAFDEMFLAMMTRHHEGAIAVAETEQSDGENAEALALAKKIVADQTSEITEMEQMLKS
ncbi:MAG: DUF305 domain-containing protein [Propionibacteriales bacterium]|nr:DUF305 domain-containing protein [Propionibacteriales bacterium]